ncbi:MAG: hypothetical protein ACFFD8_05585 [Candidatus Thorarchaeota archaeon]
MNAEELLRKYQQLVNTPPDSPSLFNESGESISTLLQSSSVRVLLVRTINEPKSVSIEVEIWLPGSTQGQLSLEPTGSKKNQETDLGKVLFQMIECLQYLHRLYESGFTIDVIRHDCLWTASQTFQKLPSLETFELLLPP